MQHRLQAGPAEPDGRAPKLRKGDAWKRFEFTVKVSDATIDATAPKPHFVLDMLRLPSNCYGGGALLGHIA